MFIFNSDTRRRFGNWFGPGGAPVWQEHGYPRVSINVLKAKRMKADLYIAQYKSSLLNDVIPFWEKNSVDHQDGGFYTSLTRDGSVFDTDKFVWLQARQVWTFSMLYNCVDSRKEWQDMAIHGAEFLKKYGRDESGNWYFSLDKSGRPLVQPYNIFSDCFAAMGFGQLSQATRADEYGEIAYRTFRNILAKQDNPKGSYSKGFPGTRPLKSFSLPMILSNLVLEIEHLLPAAVVEETIDKAIHEVMNVFYQPDINLILENVQPDGSRSDSYEGRVINPGHGLEALWFIMDLAARRNDRALIEKATGIALNILEYGWDKENGGIFYFLDHLGKPPLQLEWDQKLWWVHAEAIVCMLKAYRHTGREDCKNWFVKLHAYTFKHFADPEYGEWFGYLNRAGEVLLPLKGGKWKGCFHVPRSLYQAWKTLETIQKQEATIL